jgi:pimeloyl-ACP methyl ester carboxylesterase
VNEIFFTLFLPSSPEPEAGWPVAIFGVGTGGSKDANAVAIAAVMAEHGIATIAINPVGHGFGPLTTLTVNRTSSEPATFSGGGRGFDQNHDGVIENNEGENALDPRTIIWNRDGRRQTGVDTMQLVREIQVGMDVSGSGRRDLDPSRIYYVGFSYGGILGSYFLAVEPDVRTGVLNGASGSPIENRRQSVPLRPDVGRRFLESRTPPLINSAGVTRLSGVSVTSPYFNEDLPPRVGATLSVRLADGTDQVIQSPVLNPVPGALAIQEVFENVEWVGQSVNPVAYAPHLRKDPLPGVPAKSVIVQFAKGDQTAPNPAESALVRAGDLADRTTFYRHDLTFAEEPRIEHNPHPFLLFITNPAGVLPFAREVCLGAQEQVATFFASDGKEIVHPEPARLFEEPIHLPLPEELNFIPDP